MKLWNKKPQCLSQVPVNNSQGIKSAAQWSWILAIILQLVSVGFHERDWLMWKTLTVKIYYFRRNCTVPLDHPCEITNENGSKHDMKPPIFLCPSASENWGYFIAVFSIRIGVDCKPLKVGERELCRPRGWVQEIFLQNELLKSATSSSLSKLCFETNKQMWNILLFSCLPHTKAYTFILWTSLLCCSAWPTISHTSFVPFHLL